MSGNLGIPGLLDHLPDSPRCGKHASRSQENRDARKLALYKLQVNLEMPAEDPTEHLSCYNEEMDICTDSFAALAVMRVQQLREAGLKPIIFVDHKSSLDPWIPGAFGDVDFGLADHRHLEFMDFEYCDDYPFEAEDNFFLTLRTLAVLRECPTREKITTVRMTVFQPRLKNITTTVMKTEELYAWEDQVLNSATRSVREARSRLCWKPPGPVSEKRLAMVRALSDEISHENQK